MIKMITTVWKLVEWFIFYQVNILDSWLLKKMQSYIRSNLKQQIPTERQVNTHKILMWAGHTRAAHLARKQLLYYFTISKQLWQFYLSWTRLSKSKSQPTHFQGHFLCCYDYKPDVIETIFENKLVGHALLVDTAGHIRWKAHGTPTPDELSFLVDCTTSLQNEI